MPSLTYAQSVNAALKRALTDIPETLLFGEDVGVPGGVFGVTKGLTSAFGNRVFDTPISESAILGGAVGAALMGRRPIVEIMWADFSLVALDQIINQAANVRYVSRGRLTAPITIRTQQGTAPGACAQHSQSLEALFAHIPGLVVGMPATSQDAHDMLLSAIHCDDPTIVIENRSLYHGARTEVTIDGPVEPVGGSRVRRNGTDVTLVTWGAMSSTASEAADDLAADGIQTEVIDMRWLRPLDMPAVLDSLRKTRRLVVLHEAHTVGGLGAEIVAAVAESDVRLDAAPIRIGMAPTRIPAAPSLLGAVLPGKADVTAAVRSLLGRPVPVGSAAL
jgi:acetoin:2,6-dichlorophenolindophenol oxidoreductase subunit beta